MKKLLLIALLIVESLFAENYDYFLTDINSSSATYLETISSDYFENHITLHYFGHQN